jgi:hypothetical protein
LQEQQLINQLDASALRPRERDQISDLRDLVNDLLTERTMIMQLIKTLPYSAGTFIKEGDPLTTLRNYQGRLFSESKDIERIREEHGQMRRDIAGLRRVLGTQTPFD